MSSICIIWVFYWQCQNMVKLSLNRAQFIVLNRYKAFTMGGTVVLWSNIPTFYDRRATDLHPRH